MLKWAIIFGIIAFIAGGLGFVWVAGAAAAIAKILFFLFVALCLLFLVAAVFVGRRIM